MSEEYSNKKFWDDYWGEEKRNGYEFLFSDIVDEYIDWKRISNYMEIGGAPGTIMSYMFHVHNLDVSTVDFCNSDILTNLLDNNNVKNYKLFNEDFSKFDISKHYKKYDLVASWGFIEHFELDKTREFIQKHKAMVADNGYLIIELPNIRGFNWIIYRVVNKELLKIHNIKTMDLNFLSEEINKGNEFQVMYGNYYLTSFFEYNSSNEFFSRHQIIRKVFKALKSFFKMIRINNLPNRLFSPYILFIARRVDA